MWFHNWRRFFKYNDKTHFKIGIQPRHRRLHRRFAAIRRNLHSQKNARHRPQTAERAEHAKQNEQEYSDGQIPISPFRADTSDNDPFSSEGGVVPFAKRDDCNTEATDSAISFARMSEIYLRQKKVSQLTRVTEENDDAGVAGRVRNRAGNQRVSPLGRTPAYGDTLNSAPRPSCRRPPPGTLRTEQFQLRQQSPHAPPRNNIPRFHAQKNSGRMKRKYQKRQPTA